MSFAISGIIIGASSLGYGIYNGIQTQNAANDQMNKQNQLQQQQLDQATTQQKNAQSTNDANQQRNQQEQVLASLGLGKQGYGGTILTSPLGVPGTNTGGTSGAKTILGA